jgi:Tfp pilus assembly protein PilZ
MRAPDTAERVGVAVVRVWLERPNGTQLRARITTQELGDGEEASTVATSIDTILETLRAWLEAFVAR